MASPGDGHLVTFSTFFQVGFQKRLIGSYPYPTAHRENTDAPPQPPALSIDT